MYNAHKMTSTSYHKTIGIQYIAYYENDSFSKQNKHHLHKVNPCTLFMVTYAMSFILQ